MTSGPYRQLPRLIAMVTLSLIMANPASPAPRVDTAAYGVNADGSTVTCFTLTNDHGISVKLLDMGGVITEVNVPDRRGAVGNVVLGLGNLPAYRATATLNALVGRYANRLKNGFSLDGTHFTLAAKENGVTLHGGVDPYGARLWSAQPSATATTASVRLSLVSADGDQGFPGTLDIRVTYSLTDADDFQLDYAASTDKATVVNLTNHLYFNLAGNGSGTVYGQQLKVFADQYTPVDADMVPTGDLAPVAGTPFDFRELRPIGARIRSNEPQMVIAHGYDHNFVLRKPSGPMPALAAIMFDPGSGRILELRTTEPGLQVYSANFMTGALVSAAGTTLRQGDGLALEPQHFPNSPNVVTFPSTVLRPGEMLRSTSIFHFSTDVRRGRSRVSHGPAAVGYWQQDCCQFNSDGT